jgi:hypothetical protein
MLRYAYIHRALLTHRDNTSRSQCNTPRTYMLTSIPSNTHSHHIIINLLLYTQPAQEESRGLYTIPRVSTFRQTSLTTTKMPSTHRSSRSAASEGIRSPTSSEASTLPGDEYRRLQKLQQQARLNTYFEQPHLPPSYTSIRPKTSYQAWPHLTRERRSEISEVANATRLALGSSFDFTDESYNCSQRSGAVDTLRSAATRRDDVASEKEKSIPQRYIDEFNKRWHEDDLQYERQHQYKADYTPKAAWRSHAGMYVDTKSRPPPRREAMPRYLLQDQETSRPVRFDGASRDEPRPLACAQVYEATASRFSSETLETRESEPKRSFWNRFR